MNDEDDDDEDDEGDDLFRPNSSGISSDEDLY